MSNNDTRINPKHYIGKVVKNDILYVFGSIALTGALAYGMVDNIYDAVHEEPDNIGTAQQDSTYKTYSFRYALSNYNVVWRDIYIINPLLMLRNSLSELDYTL